MRALITGGNGQLGVALRDSCPDDTALVVTDQASLDITDEATVAARLQQEQPQLIINAAAYTAVDLAEAEPDLAQAVNATGARILAEGARDAGARLIHVSTDFVFDGAARIPYTPAAQPNPQSVYGSTKREGELGVLEVLPEAGLVLRTAWLYGHTGSNFVKTILKLLQTRDELSVVTDQVGTPTWADSLAAAIWKFARRPDLQGIYHWTDAGQASRHEQAVAIQEEALSLGLVGNEIPIRESLTEIAEGVAMRPAYSVLDCAASYAALGLTPRHWRENLREMLKGLTT